MFNSSNRTNHLKIKESDQPTDTVRCIVWNAYLAIPCFITAGWDATATLYQIVGNEVEKNW